MTGLMAKPASRTKSWGDKPSFETTAPNKPYSPTENQRPKAETSKMKTQITTNSNQISNNIETENDQNSNDEKDSYENDD